MTNVVNLIPEELTYVELLQEHISKLTEGQASQKIGFLVIAGTHDNGNAFYSTLAGNSVIEALGVLENVKLDVFRKYV